MSVWLTIPSARPPAEADVALSKWRAQGYQIALWRDSEFDYCRSDNAGSAEIGAPIYPGYARAVNELISLVMSVDQAAEWFVIGGDDTLPDPDHTADEIAEQCRVRFTGLNWPPRGSSLGMSTPWEFLRYAGPSDQHNASTFGVMQPTGDRWGENPDHPRVDMRSAYIDRVAGSAWLGREFCKRVNGGRGPLWSGNPNAEREIDRQGYKHMWVDEELRHVAVRLGVYWERRDLTQHHAHAGRVPNYSSDMIPPHLRKWTVGEEGRKHWKESETLFFSRRDAGFPGSEPL